MTNTTDRSVSEGVSNTNLVLLHSERLHPTEECIPERIQEVSAKILREGIWSDPIMVESGSLIVMDGHHRLAFAMQNGLKRVPCLLVQYSDVMLSTWCNDIDISPKEVITRGLTGKLLPPKSTRHTLLSPASYVCNYPLALLRDTLPVSLDDP